MLFNSVEFILFAIAFYAVWPAFRSRPQRRWAFIIVASFFFYGWWDVRFLPLLVVTALIDFFAGILMERYPGRKRLFLVISLSANLGLLGLFKYGVFLAHGIEAALALGGVHAQIRPHIPAFVAVLPPGISFYTFQSMSYSIDVYRGRARPTHSVLQFLAAVSLFPHLVAGPIMRATDLLPQLEQDRRATEAERWDATVLIAGGYFKKVVLADNLAAAVNSAFLAPVPAPSGTYWWIIVTMFAVQIYCDFSGYSDIGRGLAKWMGYDFIVNFNHPYASRSLRDFWTRWHISQSTWFRDYVYIPLGGGRGSALRTHVNAWITMLLSGLWHGAALTYVMWGAIHAWLLSVERVTRWPERLRRFSFGPALATAIVLVQVWVAWVFFRADSIGKALSIVKIMFTFPGVGLGDLTARGEKGPFVALGLAIAFEVAAVRGVAAELLARPGRFYQPLFIAAALAACVYLRGPGNAFIYFQF